MKITISVPDYNRFEGLRIPWVDNHFIEVSLDENCVYIRANSEGLETLARQMLTLAQIDVPIGRHINLTGESGLVLGSLDLEIHKIEP